jgi:hypothetical protein
MANTTNFNWETPDDTDLVKDGAAAIRTLGSAIDTSLVDLKGGTTGQVLAKNSNTDMDFVWATDASGIPATIFDAKGDLIVASAADTAARLAVGTNGHVLTADSTATNGIKWAAAAGGGKILQVVSSVYETNTTIASTSYTTTGLSASITPSSTNSKILVLTTQGYGMFNQPDSGRFIMACKIERDIASGGYSTVYRPVDTTQDNMEDIGQVTEQLRALLSMSYLDSPSTTSTCTYRTVAKTNSTASSQSVQFQLGGTSGQRGQSSIILMEVGA